MSEVVNKGQYRIRSEDKPVRRQIRESPYIPAIVELRRCERRRGLREEACHRGSLVGRHGEDIAEASPAENNLLTGAFRVVYGRARIHLCSTDCGYEGTGDREARIKYPSIIRCSSYNNDSNDTSMLN